MTTQQAVFADTIACMKKAIKRKAYDSDSDTSIDKCTNRGNKLRKRARFVYEGQLVPPSGPQVYRRTIEHAGYHREILYRNPPLIDEDGYEVDSDDDERARSALDATAHLNPFTQVKLERLLAPLTAVSELPDHPTLSKPFTSQTITHLTQQARDMIQKEMSFLWKLKHLMTKMSGDNNWIPCQNVEGEDDWALFLDNQSHSLGNLSKNVNLTEKKHQVSSGRALIGAEKHSPDSIIAAVKQLIAKEQQNGNGNRNNDTALSEEETLKKRELHVGNESNSTHENHDQKNFLISKQPELTHSLGTVEVSRVTEDLEYIPITHRMRTRAQTQADTETITGKNTKEPHEINDESFVHPYFLATQSSRPDRDVGLPHNEASETRRVLQLYIQKQEEVCRGVKKIYDGLLKADRYRKLIIKWAKADRHVGINRDMSDGEDWYDNEEWGLDEDLKKGQDEEEEDAATTAKKTRTRRQ
ncbi:hypothetical protein BGHDH14_bgh00064 [Blumeria hordei DH14]|uniref:Transcriptional regulatory protein RXT2 N-terminal domain-containing protein n=1 Tax=Blumeria graminis f. sp. hordei (strain DH14) TaxID=546991 RepID=N1JIZ3_BLUG1|nr:hypothetical protein BGHDH14_bgh00064 [Blumeria hordei DH14]